MIEPGREPSELRIEGAEVRVGAQKRFLREVGDVGGRMNARPDEICDPSLVAVDQQAEPLAISG